ncbi:MAG: tripartite tricarboxylate transporter substrate binding protein [Rhodovarius sp.]|nr:tripartite tricarboxylate transporter substrate binding protein [Rhodovarius sp.]MCX7932688.1 tripartite tricarboxylate transporter substrate binding protein [Rhodovarius sp.]MDW8316014.1 tripartite tricarboxylate transporter substrate binding protein [Rhodovarius sp.]
MRTPRRPLPLLLLPLLSASQTARAQADWPNRPVTVVVPWPAGGSTDVMTRVLTQQLAAATGQPFVVENRAGATGTVGHAHVARARGDGYTLLVGTNSTYAIAPHLMAQLPYDNETALAPIMLIATNPQILVAHPAQPFRDFAGFLAFARAHPGRLSFASSGPGGTSHLATELLMQMAGIEMLHVPYRGGAPALQAQLSGEVQVTFVDTIVAVPHIRSGQLRPLGVSTAARTPLAPDVPTIAEAGLPGFESSTDFALFAPGETPPALIARIHAAFAQALAEPAVRERLIAQGMTPIAGRTEDFRAYQRRESEKWGALIRARNIRAS